MKPVVKSKKQPRKVASHRSSQEWEVWLESRARKFLKVLSSKRVPGGKALAKAQISLSVVSDRRIRDINREWRNKDKSTDVLSFPQWEPSRLKGLSSFQGEVLELGDIVISLDRAKEQAGERGISLEKEMALLLAHGLLHLLGFDHEVSKTEAAKMKRWERVLLGSRGLI